MADARAPRRHESKRRWIPWKTPEGERAFRAFVKFFGRHEAGFLKASANLDADPFYLHGFGMGWLLAGPEGRDPVALLWAGFDEWEVQRRRRLVGWFSIRLLPEADRRSDLLPSSKEMKTGLDLVSRFLRSRGVTEVIGPVHLGFHRDPDWGVREKSSADAGLMKALREAGLTSERLARRIQVPVRQIQSFPSFLAEVELARDGGKVALRPLRRRPLWRGLRLTTDPLARVEEAEWLRLSELAFESIWDRGFAEAVPPSPGEWRAVAASRGGRSFLEWSSWIEVAGEPAGFVWAWRHGDAVRVQRILIHERYRDFHLAPFALQRLAEKAREQRLTFLDAGPFPSQGAWDDLMAGFLGESGARVADESVELFVLEV